MRQKLEVARLRDIPEISDELENKSADETDHLCHCRFELMRRKKKRNFW